MNLQQLEERMRSIQSDLRGLAEIQEPSDDDVILQDTLIQEHGEIEARISPVRQRMADLERIRALSAEPENREEPATGQGLTVLSRSNRDPLEDLDRVRMNMVPAKDLQVRAMNLIERDANNRRWDIPQAHAEEATVRAQDTSGVAKHVLLTGSEEYREAFRSYLQSPNDLTPFQSSGLREEMAYRAVNLTNASGGFLLPYVLDPSIILNNSSSANPFRRICRVVQTTSNAWQGVTSAGVNGAWVAEAATAADAAPTDLAQVKITPAKGAVWILGSYEALDDTDFGVQLPGLLADAKDRMESAAFCTGTGTNSPLGIVVGMGVSGHVTPAVTGTAFGGTGNIKDIGLLMAAVPPRFRKSPACAFMANIVHINNIRAMDQYGGGGFWANLTSPTPPSLYGYPIYEGSDLPSVTTGTSAASGTASDTLFLGDWNQMVLCDRVGISMLYDPLIKGTGASAQLPAGSAGWYMFWRVGSAVSTTAAFRNLAVS